MFMKSKSTNNLRWLTVIVLLSTMVMLTLLRSAPVYAATITSAQSGNWDTMTTWVGGVIPGATDAVVIALGHNVNINSADRTCGDITITGTLTLTNGNVLYVQGGGTSPVTTGAVAGHGTIVGTATGGTDIKLYGSWSFNGTITNRVSVAFQGPTDATVSAVSANSFRNIYFEKNAGTTLFLSVTPIQGNTFTMTSGNICYNQNGAQVVKPATYPANLTLAGSGVKTTTSVTVNGVLSMEGTATASVAPTYGTAATLQYNTATARTAGAEWITPFAATGGVIIANTGTITLNNAKVFNANVPLTINSGATLSTNASNYAVTFGGNFINNGGTFTAGSSAITIANTSATQSIAGFTTTGTVSMTKTGGVATFTGNVTGGALTINGGGGTLNLGSGLTHTFTGAWTRTAGTLNGSSNTLKIGGNVSGTGGTFAASTGTVEWNAAGAQTVAGITYNNLILSSSGNKSIASDTAVNGNLAISGTAKANLAAGSNINANSLTLGGLNKINGTWGSTTATSATYHDNNYFTATTGYVTVSTDTRPTPSFSSLLASQAITYGTANVTLSGTVSASGPIYPANGENVSVTINSVSQNATISGGAGGFSISFPTATIPYPASAYTITYYYAGNTNLKTATDTSTTLTVNKATPTITWSTPADITYGTALSSTQLNAATSPSVSGTFAYTPASGTVLGAGSSQTLSVLFNPTDTTNYSTASKTVTINVNTKALTVTGITANNKIYDGGTTATLNTTGYILHGIVGTDVVTLNSSGYTAAFSDANVGTGKAVTVSGLALSGASAGNYTLTQPTGLIANITKSTPTITWANPADIIYGTALSGTQLNATASVPGAFVYTPPSGTVLNVGDGQNLRVDFTPTDTANYTNASKNVSINVKPVPHTIDITAPSNISNWALNIGSNTNSGPLTVTVSPFGANWSVMAYDANSTTAGYMTGWNGTASIKLTYPMNVSGNYGNVTLPVGGNISKGSGNYSGNVTFSQVVTWNDDPGTYQIVVMFIATVN